MVKSINKIKNERYSLCPPVKGGIQFWEINDMREMFALVSIHNTFPNAEIVAKKLYWVLLEVNNLED